MSLISFEQAFEQWQDMVNEFNIDQTDNCMMSESWTNSTDGLCKDGEFNGLMYHHCPAWDDGCGYDGEDTFDFLCEALNLHPIEVAEDIELLREWLDDESTLAPIWVTAYIKGNRTNVQIYRDLLEVFDDLV